MPRAYGQALLTCDAVAHDPGTGKITLYGVFDRIWASSFPAVHPLFSIYWRCLVPGPGRVAVSIVRPDGAALVDLEPLEAGKEGAQSAQGTYTLGGFEFPTDGDYALSLRYNGEEALRSSLFVGKKEQQ